MLWHVVEKDDYGTDWHQVRDDVYAMERLDTQEDAVEAAKKYLTLVNCNNALTKEEKRSGMEAYMFIENEGCFLGILDGEEWFLDYRQNVTGKLEDGTKGVIHEKGDIVMEPPHFELEGKTEVAVREVRGT